MTTVEDRQARQTARRDLFELIRYCVVATCITVVVVVLIVAN